MENYRAKRSYDVTMESVTISSIHSVNGFDVSVRLSPGLGLVGAGMVDGGSDTPAGLCRDHPGKGKTVYSLLLRERTHRRAFEKYLNLGGIRISDFH